MHNSKSRIHQKFVAFYNGFWEISTRERCRYAWGGATGTWPTVSNIKIINSTLVYMCIFTKLLIHKGAVWAFYTINKKMSCPPLVIYEIFSWFARLLRRLTNTRKAGKPPTAFEQCTLLLCPSKLNLYVTSRK